MQPCFFSRGRAFFRRPWPILFFAAFAASLWGEPGTAPVTVTVDHHRCLVVEPPGLKPDAPVVVVLHGLGVNAEDWLSLPAGLKLPPCRFVFPDGPLLLPGYSEGQYAWYDPQTHDWGGYLTSRNYLFDVMDRFSRDSAQPRPVLLMGFSQGGGMSLEAGLNYKGNLKAIVCMCGYIWDPSKTLAHPPCPPATPILMTYGTLEPSESLDRYQRTWGALNQAGYQPVIRSFRTGHKAPAETLDAVSKFLNRVLQGKSWRLAN